MKLTNSVLKDVRSSVGLTEDSEDFDTELLMHINSAIGELVQNGVTSNTLIVGVDQTWGDLTDPSKVEGNEYFQMVPLFITMSTKFLFDPPPPSTVEFYQNNINKLLWRLKIAYEKVMKEEKK